MISNLKKDEQKTDCKIEDLFPRKIEKTETCLATKLASIHDRKDHFYPYTVPKQRALQPIILRKTRSHWGILHCFPATLSDQIQNENDSKTYFQISLVKDQYWIGRYIHIIDQLI
jgi:hypothetical protein